MVSSPPSTPLRAAWRAWLVRHTKPVKYAVKAAILSRRPGLYWATRRLLRGWGEPEMALVPLLCQPNHATVDGGANWGHYTFLAHGYSRCCHAFEPIPRLARTLARGYHGSDRVIVHPCALSDRDGDVTLRIPSTELGYSTIDPHVRFGGKIDTAAGIREIRVRTRRLDSLVLGRVGFIKLDVEGHEDAILRGAEQLLARDRPRVLVEVEERHRPGAVQAVSRRMIATGYAPLFIWQGRVRAWGDFDPTQHQGSTDPGTHVRNLIFVPVGEARSFVEEANTWLRQPQPRYELFAAPGRR